MPYRQTEEGLIKATIGKKLPIDKTPSYSHRYMCRRTNKLNIDINYRLDDDDRIIIAIDSTGIKVTNRDQWMQDKWNIGKRGYLKIHFAAVDIKTNEFVALEVTTDEKVYDGKVMVQLVVEQVLENKNIKIKSVLVDGGGIYENNKNFKYLQKKKILPGIKVRKNSLPYHPKTIR